MPHDPQRQALLIGSHRACGVKLLPIVAEGEPLVNCEFYIGSGQRVRIAVSKQFAQELSAALLFAHSTDKKREARP